MDLFVQWKKISTFDAPVLDRGFGFPILSPYAAVFCLRYDELLFLRHYWNFKVIF